MIWNGGESLTVIAAIQATDKLIGSLNSSIGATISRGVFFCNRYFTPDFSSLWLSLEMLDQLI